VLLASSGQTKGLVDNELVDEGVGGGADSDSQDDSEGDQLRRNLLQGTQTLGDGVGCFVIVSAIRSLHSFLALLPMDPPMTDSFRQTLLVLLPL
jgi:hypothetical protein